MKAITSQLIASLRQNRGAALFALVAAVFPAASSLADDIGSGTLYYTTFGDSVSGRPGGIGVVNYNFDVGASSSLTFNGNNLFGGEKGVDGIAFAGDGNLAVGGQSATVYKVQPGTGTTLTAPTAAGTTAFHVMVAPDGNIWSAGNPDSLAKFNSTLSANGTVLFLHGGDTVASSLAWATSDPTKAFYVNSDQTGVNPGNFGKVDLTTGLTTRLLSGLAGAGGMTYDPYTKTLILVGANTVLQVDPNNPTVILSQKTIAPDPNKANFSAFDTVSVDGKGHIFIANNDGDLVLEDIATTGLVASPDGIASTMLAQYLDDIVPLVGPGSNPNPPVPDSIGFATTALVLGGICLLGLRGRKAVQSV